jgi:hypothetical protein
MICCDMTPCEFLERLKRFGRCFLNMKQVYLSIILLRIYMISYPEVRYLDSYHCDNLKAQVRIISIKSLPRKFLPSDAFLTF